MIGLTNIDSYNKNAEIGAYTTTLQLRYRIELHSLSPKVPLLPSEKKNGARSQSA